MLCKRQTSTEFANTDYMMRMCYNEPDVWLYSVYISTLLCATNRIAKNVDADCAFSAVFFDVFLSRYKLEPILVNEFSALGQLSA